MEVSQRHLKDWINSYLLYTANHEPTLLYKEWMAVAALSAAMGRRLWLPWEKNIYPNMYILLVGPPTARKGTAMFPSKCLLRANNIPMCAEAITREAFFEDMEAATIALKDMPPEYTCEFSSTFTVFSEEFTSFIGYDRGEFLANLCDLWDCPDSWTYRTKGKGVNKMKGICLNLIAGTTPELLCKNLPAEAIGGGFTSRTILVYADKKDRSVSDPRHTEEDRLLFNMLAEDLAHISTLRGPFRISDRWYKAYDNFYQQQDKVSPISHFKFEHYIGRRQTHLQKLCMVFCIARGDDLELQLQDFQRAEDLLIRTEKLMPAVFAGHGRVAAASIRPRVVAYLKRVGSVELKALHGAFLNDMEWAELEETLKGLYGNRQIDIRVEGSGPLAQKIIVWVDGKDSA
jgi:hypothetical protein